MICPNLNDPLIKQEFDALVAEIGEDAAYNAWYLHDGNVPKSEYVTFENYNKSDFLQEVGTLEQYKAYRKSLGDKAPSDIDEDESNFTSYIYDEEEMREYLSLKDKALSNVTSRVFDKLPENLKNKTTPLVYKNFIKEKFNNPRIFYHGTSGGEFEQFSKDKFFTGEGAMVHGEGFYFTENPITAQNYSELKTKEYGGEEEGPAYDLEYEEYKKAQEDWKASDKSQSESSFIDERLDKFKKDNGINIVNSVLEYNNPIETTDPIYINIKKNNNPSKTTEKLKELGYDSIIHYVRETSNYQQEGEKHIIVFDPEQVYILGSKKDIEGFREFVTKPALQQNSIERSPETQFEDYNSSSFANTEFSNQEDRQIMFERVRELGKMFPGLLFRQIPVTDGTYRLEGYLKSEGTVASFKPKPSNTISILKQEEFREGLEEGKITAPFLYWSQTTSKIVSEKNVVVDRILPDRFEGRYVDTDEERTFKYNNIIDESSEKTMTRREQTVFKNNLEIGNNITVETQQDTYTGEVSDILPDAVRIFMADGRQIEIPYNEIFKANAEIALSQVIQKLKNTLSSQLAIYRKKTKTADQQRRIQSYTEALTVLDNYKELEDLNKFLIEVDKNIIRCASILNNLSTNENIESNEKRLYVISYVKDVIDSFAEVKRLNSVIKNFEGSDKLKDSMEGLLLRLNVVETQYYETAIPQLGKLLWEYYDPRLNELLIANDEDPWSEERIIEELRDPSKDIDYFNKVFVAPSNVDDVIMGLFVKMIKGGKEKARMSDERFLRELVPLVQKLRTKYGEERFKNIVKSFYTLEDVVQEKDGVKKTIQVRKFHDTHDYKDWYRITGDFYYRIGDTIKRENRAVEYNDAVGRSIAIGDRNALYAELNAYRAEFGIEMSAEKSKTNMESLRFKNEDVFHQTLSNFYTIVDSIEEADPNTSITVQNEITGELMYYNYIEGKPRFEPNPSKFETDAYKQLTGDTIDPDIKDLFKYMMKEYNDANSKLPFSKRLNGRVPVKYKQSFWKSLKENFLIPLINLKFSAEGIKKAWKGFWKDNAKQYRTKIDGKAYKEIPIGMTSIIAVEESSDDIIHSTMMFVREANNFHYMNEFLGAADTIVEVLDKGRPEDESQHERTKSNINNRKEAILKFVDQQMFGETNISTGPLGKVLDFLATSTALNQIGLDPGSWATNFFAGNWANLAEGLGGRFFTLKDIHWANKEFLRMQFKERQKLINMIDSLDAIQGRFHKQFGDQLLTFKEKYGKLDTLFIGQDLAELQIQGTAMLAFLKHNNIPIPADGIFTTDNTENLQETKNLLHAINKRNHGVYNTLDRLYYQNNALFRLFLQFRKFIVPIFRARYTGIFSGKKRIDIEMGTVEQGWYRLAWDFIRESIKAGNGLPAMLRQYNSASDIQKEGIRRTAVDFIGFMVLSTIFLVATSGDDEDDEKSQFEWFLIFQLSKITSEIGLLLPFLGFSDKLRIINNPFAAAPQINQLISLFSGILDFTPDKNGDISINKEYLRDTGMHEKGDLKIWGKISKLNPLDNMLEIAYSEEMYKNFEAASRR
jgi:hypothetical protein